jgi:hypothetical protein
MAQCTGFCVCVCDFLFYTYLVMKRFGGIGRWIGLDVGWRDACIWVYSMWRGGVDVWSLWVKRTMGH